VHGGRTAGSCMWRIRRGFDARQPVALLWGLRICAHTAPASTSAQASSCGQVKNLAGRASVHHSRQGPGASSPGRLRRFRHWPW
jgi:hypothetical protein